MFNQNEVITTSSEVVEDISFNKSLLLSFSKLEEFSRFEDCSFNDQLIQTFNIKNGYCTDQNIPLLNNYTFTSSFNLKTFQTIKNHFKSIFKVTYPEEFFQDVYQKKYFTIIVKDSHSKEVIGFSHIDINKMKKSADILTLGVVKEFQNKKIGSMLLRKVLDELRLLGIIDVTLIVQKSNKIAINMYEKFGFFTKETLDNYYSFGDENQNRALLMMIKLNIPRKWIEKLFKKLSICYYKY